MSLLQMSLSGAAMILAILLVRTLALQRLPKRLFPALWWLVLIRLLVPFSLPAPCSENGTSRRISTCPRRAVCTRFSAAPCRWRYTSPGQQ